MASNFWTSRIAAAKRQYASQHHHRSSHLDRFNIDDFEVEEEVRPDFPCPYCDEDFDIGSLCSHLEDEHSYESKVAVSSFLRFGLLGRCNFCCCLSARAWFLFYVYVAEFVNFMLQNLILLSFLRKRGGKVIVIALDFSFFVQTGKVLTFTLLGVFA
ncbi:hypothetical protein OIU76_026226 [Salix suchowensis]|nr:hypothetical protein OIU76_026226 [Salix suchowensis]